MRVPEYEDVRCISINICFSIHFISTLQYRSEYEVICCLPGLLPMHSHVSLAVLMAMARKLSGWSRRSVEIHWVLGRYSSRKLFLGNPRWGDRRCAGQALSTLESRHGALIGRCSDRRVGNKSARHLFVRDFTLKIKLHCSVLLEKKEK